MVEGDPYLVPYAFSGTDADYLYLVNGALDAVDGVSLRQSCEDGAYTADLLPSQGQTASFTFSVTHGRCRLPVSIGSMESALLTIRRISDKPIS
jgi:hypothetical protein